MVWGGVPWVAQPRVPRVSAQATAAHLPVCPPTHTRVTPCDPQTPPGVPTALAPPGGIPGTQMTAPQHSGSGGL